MHPKASLRFVALSRLSLYISSPERPPRSATPQRIEPQQEHIMGDLDAIWRAIRFGMNRTLGLVNGAGIFGGGEDRPRTIFAANTVWSRT